MIGFLSFENEKSAAANGAQLPNGFKVDTDMRRINQSQADIKPFHYRSRERRHWSPGEPIPTTYDPDPWAALERHAAAHEMDEQRRRFNGRRQTRPADRRAA